MKKLFVALSMTVLFFFLAAALLGDRAVATDFQSNSITPGGGNVTFTRSTTDVNGNIYTTGFYNNTFNYGSLSAPTLAAGITNFFLLKTDAVGNGLWLTSSISSTMPFVQGTAIAVDTAGSVYVGMQATNGTSSVVTINVAVDATFVLNPSTAESFIAKYAQSSGAFVWARAEPIGTSVICGLAATLDNASIIAAGSFRGVGVFYTIPRTAIPGGADNTFVVKINASSGATIWATNATCSTGGYNDGTSMALDSSGNIYTVGTFGGTIFGGKTYQLTANSTNIVSSSAFIIKWTNSPGASVPPVPQWALATTDTSNSFTSANDIAMDVNSNLYVAFSLTRTDPTSTNTIGLNIFGTNNLTHYTQTNGGVSEGSIIKFDSNGNILWGTGTLGAAGTTNLNTRIAANTNFVYSIGSFGPGAVTFGGATFGTTLGTPADSFILQLTNSTGRLGFIARVNGSGAIPALLPQDLVVSNGASGDTLELVGALAGSPGSNSFIAQYGVKGPFQYTINGGSNVTITNYTGPGGTVTIPSSILGLPVTEIGYQAFYDARTVTNLIIPNSVTSIDGYAFVYCSGLTNVTIGTNVTTIGTYAFEDCYSLTNVTIPNRVTSIGDGAFYDCRSLTSVVIPNSVTNLGDGAFFSCIGLTNVTLGTNLTSISDLAFDQSGLVSLTIPNTVTNIGYGAFYYCGSLTNVTIPGSVTSIGDEAFSSCYSLTSMAIPDTVTNLGADIFDGCLNLGSVSIGSGITYIDFMTLGGCPALTNLTVSANNPYYTSSGGVVFSKNTSNLIVCANGLTGNYVIPSGVTNIETGAFSGCISLTNVTIPNGVTSIGSQAFSLCLAMTSITFLGNPPATDGTEFSYSYAGFDHEVDPATVYYLSTAAGWDAYNGYFDSLPAVKLAVPTFSGLSNSQSLIYGTSSISLGGKISLAGSVYPVSGETVSVTIADHTQTTTINDATGDFSVVFNTATNGASASANVITYSYAGNGTLGLATDTSTTLTVNKAPLTVTANAQSKTYGQTVTSGSGSTNFTSSGLVNGETIGTVNISSTGSPPSAAVSGSPYAISINAAIGGNFNAVNYSITYVSGALTVNKAPLTITATSRTKTYGQNITFGSGSTFFTSSGLVNGDNAGVVTLACTGGTSNAPVSGSPYAITPSAATGPNMPNYNITYNNNSLTVTPAPLTVTGNNATKFYGATNPVFSATYSGFVNSQVLGTSDVAGNPSFITVATNTPIGTYNITNSIGTLTSMNYGFSFVNGALTVNPLPVNLTGTRVFDGNTDAPASILTITTNYDGVNLTLTGSGVLAGSAAGTEAISSFSGLTLNGTAATNYTLTGATGSVLVTPPDPLIYSTNNGAITISGYSGPGGAVVIPSVVNGLPVTAIGVNAFNGKTTITSVMISTNVLVIADEAFGACTALTNVIIPNSVTNIGNSSFNGCSALVNVIGGTNVISLGQLAFSGCYAVANFIQSTNLISVGSYTYFNCQSLTNIVLPASLTKLSDIMFDGCTSLTNVTLANTLTAISNSTFAGCSSLKSITIPASVTTIADMAFQNCAALTNLFFLGNAPTLGGANVFGGINTTTARVYYIAGATGWGATYGGLTVVELPNSPSFSNLTASQVITYGTASITLGGKVSASGPVYPAASETVSVTIAGQTQNTAVNDATGDFSLVFNTTAFGKTISPAAIKYTYTGDSALLGVTNSVTTLTVNPLPVNLTGTRLFDNNNDASASILSFTTNYDGANLTLSGSALLAGSAVGPEAITDFTELTLGGSAAVNYTLIGASGSVLITAAAGPTADFQMFTTNTSGQGVVFNAMARDAAGNIYVCGSYQNSFTYGTLTVPTLTNGQISFFLLKTDAQGNALWLSTAQSNSVSSVAATAIAVDSNGGVYVGMSCTNPTATAQTLIVDSFPFTINANAANSIIAKCSQAAGTLVWAKTDPNAASSITGLVTTADNISVIATGDFQGSASFSEIGLTSQPVGARNTFIIKIDASLGLSRWVTSAVNLPGGYNRSGGIALDSSGNIYTTGYFGGVMFSGKSYQIVANSASLSNPSAFIIKWSNPATTVAIPQWAIRSIDSTDSGSFAYAPAIDSNGNIYVPFKNFRFPTNTTDTIGLHVDGVGGSSTFSHQLGGTSEACVVSFDPNGNVLWGEGTFGDPGTTQNSIKVTINSNYVYVLGSYGGNNGNVVFDGTTSLPSENAGYFLMQLVKTNGAIGSVRPVNTLTVSPQLAPTDFQVSSSNILDIVGVTQTSPENGFIKQFTLTNQVVVGPPMSVTVVDTNVIISWPLSYRGFIAQTTTNLVNSAWTAVTNDQNQVGPDWQVTVPAAGAAGFFRVVK